MVGRRAAAVPAIVPGRAPMPHISLDFLRADIWLKWLGGDGGPAPSPRRPILE